MPGSKSSEHKQNHLQESSSSVPFSSPASPIPKNYDDPSDIMNDDNIMVTYPSEIAGSSNDDTSEPYILSSMSEEERQGSFIIPLENGLEKKSATATASATSMTEVEIKPSTSSEENKFSSNNSSGRMMGQHNQQQQQVVPVNFKKKELRCVTDVLPPLTIPTVGTGSFSPLGSVGSMSMDTATPRQFQLPKFYDSEEEGVGSLVLVPSTSKSLASPRMMTTPTNSSNNGAPPPPLPKDYRHGLSTTPAHLLPYQQRKKLMVEAHPPQQQQHQQHVATDKRPPVIPTPTNTTTTTTNNTKPLFDRNGMVVVVASEPPPIVTNAELARKYGGVAEIPPFRGVQPPQQSGGDDDANNGMKKSKSADASNVKLLSSSKVNAAIAVVSSPSNNVNSEKREKRIVDTGTTTNKESSSSKQAPSSSSQRPPGLVIQQHQEVICPQSPSLRSSSPEGSYHIRVSSCGSISSLGSMAVDSDSIRHAPKREQQQQQYSGHYNRDGGLHHHQQQEEEQYYQMQHQLPPPPPNHYYGGYPQTAGPMRGPPPPQNGFVDLSQDIAMYLHREQIANGGGVEGMERASSAYNHHGGGGGEYPPQNYWNHNPSYGWGGGGQHYATPPQAEPIPPPLTQVPNMQMGHRSRLPSISDDDWSEDLEKYKQVDTMDGGEDGKRGGGGGRGNNGNQQSSYPLPPQRSYNYGRDRMAYPHQLPPPVKNRQRDPTKRKENHSQQRSENRPNERSSLLGRSNNRNYDQDGGWNNVDNDPNTSSYYKTPPRRGGNKKNNPQETKSTKRKKSKRRRREKEKLRNLYPSTDSSPEQEEEKFRRSIRSARRKKRHGGGRKRREDDVSDTMSETYSESFTMTSLTERLKSAEANNVNAFQMMIIRTKLLICNLPLSAAAISFSIVLLGIVWLRRAEEILTSCKEVNFHSSQCNFPEFPGCYFCDTFDRRYQVATKFHTVCSYVGGVSVALYAAKATFFGRVFIDEMSSPTTASPAGLIFMTMALAFTGKGAAGAVAVFVASFLHLALLLWFIYMSLAYQTMPDPSWFPNTIGIGLCAVKVWFYNPLCGHFLIAMTLMLTFLYYPISLIRVALNEKMSSTICWMQMICPAISLYSLAIVMQPSFKEERPDITHFQTMQRSVYLPSMTCLFGLCIVGMISSLHGLALRWKQIQKEEFTPAHAAYSFPLLMHALAVQSYRSSLGFFSETGEVNPSLKYALEVYWIVLVTAGTLVAVVCLMMYLSFLPSWIDVNTSEELEPPAPNETSVFETVTWGESLIQPYVSPTILQSNEAGILVMTHDYENNWDTLVRTKNIPAVGFEPMMRSRTFNREREALKHLVGGQDVIHEGDEADDDFCFENVNV